MAQRVQVLLVCDLHDEEVPGVETVGFGLDGSSYEIDVCSEHGAQLREAFASYIGAARRAGRAAASTAPRKARAAAKGGNQRVAEIRAWARQNGHPVSERGRLSADLVAAYDKAN